MKKFKATVSLVCSLAVPGVTSGCAAAALGAGAGAVGAAKYTDRGATADLKGSPLQIDQHAEKAFRDLGIKKTGSSTENSGTEQKLDGTKEDMNVSVDITPGQNGVSHVEVIAKQGTFKWNKDFAKSVLDKIVAES